MKRQSTLMGGEGGWISREERDQIEIKSKEQRERRRLSFELSAEDLNRIIKKCIKGGE